MQLSEQQFWAASALKGFCYDATWQRPLFLPKGHHALGAGFVHYTAVRACRIFLPYEHHVPGAGCVAVRRPAPFAFACPMGIMRLILGLVAVQRSAPFAAEA